MAESNRQRLPAAPQPDIGPDQLGPPAPSMFLYALLSAAGILLIFLAFQIQSDWPGLLINLGSSFLTTVLVLIFVDQRLRRSELMALQGLPRRARVAFWLIASSHQRQIFRFASAQLAALDRLTQGKVVPATLDRISKREDSFLLIGPAGTGKTTILQILCQARTREFLSGETDRLPILFPLRYWIDPLSLEEAIFAHVASMSPLNRKTFAKLLGEAAVLMVLDGADEIQLASMERLSGQVDLLRSKILQGRWVVSSRDKSAVEGLRLPQVELAPFSGVELREIRRRLQ